MFSKQHMGVGTREPVRIARRTLVLGAMGWVALGGRWCDRQAAAGCGGASATFTFAAAPGTPGVVVAAAEYRQLKDPCVVFDGSSWHLYGTGWTTGSQGPVVFHAQADTITGPFTMGLPCVLEGVSGGGVGAPGVVVEDGCFHLFVQTEFQASGGAILHLTSTDGTTYVRGDTALFADPSLGEATVYDAQPCVIAGQRYLAYAAAAQVSHTELHLTRSAAGWNGPWVRLGAMMRQSEVALQNPVSCAGYEWGLEGPQLVELPDGRVLLLGVCFLGGAVKGRRQRVFAAIARAAEGPYEVLGTPFDPGSETWASGENGHPGAALVGEDVVVVYQGRQGAGRPWALGTSTISLESLR